MMSCHTSLAQDLSLVISHPRSYPWAHLLDSPLPFYFYLFFPVFFSFHLLHCELYTELDNLIVMESLCYFANKGSDDAYDVSTSLTRTMIFSAQQQACTTLFRLPFLGLDPYVVLVLIWWVFTPSALRLAIELLHARPRLVKALRKSIWLVGTFALLVSLFLPSGRKNSCSLHGL